MEAIIIFSIMVIAFFGYLIYVVKNFGVTSSISESYYRLPHKFKIFFSLFCLGIGIPAMLLGQSALMMIAGAGIAFVGGSGAYKEDMANTVHTAAAIIGIFFSQLSIFFDMNLWVLNIVSILFMLLILLFRNITKNHIWWIEVVAFLSVLIALFTKL